MHLDLRPSHSVLALALTSLLAGAGAAQGAFHATIGPSPAPVGGPIWITVSNDKPFAGSTGTCPWVVYDANDNLVFDPGCSSQSVLMGPYGWLTFTWDQRDAGGHQVPAGTYRVEITFDVGPKQSYPLVIGGTDAGLVFEGAAAIGTVSSPVIFKPRNFFLSSPQDGGELYWLLASTSSSSGIPTCGGVLPLDAGPLFNLSLLPNALFGGSLGTLGPSGTSSAPSFQIPNSASLLGLSIETAFAVLDLNAACPVKRVSAPYTLVFVD
jgi:hypothetical protein